MRALEAMGVAVHTPAVDVSNEAALRAFLDLYAAEGWPPIRGVIHAAGAFDNRLASAMTRAAFDAVVEPKLRGALLLDRLLPDLDLFVLFSSVGAFLPLPGQSNYAAANAGLDALAEDRRARGLPALSIEWGIWQDTGLVADAAGRADVAELSRQGVQSFAADRGARLFAALSAGPPTVAALPADWVQVSARPRRPRGSAIPRLRRRKREATSAGLSEQLAAATPARAAGAAAGSMSEDAVSHVLKIASARIDARKALGNMGLNSLMAIELRNRLEIALGRSLSATLAWNYPTIEAIVDYPRRRRAGRASGRGADGPAARGRTRRPRSRR